MKRIYALFLVSVTSLFVAFGASALEPFVSVEGQFVGIKNPRAVTINVSVMRDNAAVQTTTATMDEQLKFSAVLLNVQGFNLNTDSVKVDVRHVENVSLPVGLDAANPANIVYANFVEAPLSDITLNVGTIRVKWLVRVRLNALQGVNLISFYGDPSASVGSLLTNVLNPWPTFALINDDANGQLNAFLQASPPANKVLQPWQGVLASFTEAKAIEFWGAEWTPEQMAFPLIANIVNIRGIPFAGANITPEALWTKLVEIQAQPRVLVLYDAGLTMWYMRTATFTTPLTSTQRRSINLVPGDGWIVIPGADKTLDMKTLAPAAAPNRNLRVDNLTEMSPEKILALAPITEEQRQELSKITGLVPPPAVEPRGKAAMTWGGLKRR